MKARFTRRALRHLDSIHAYISNDSPQAARQQVERILSAIELLELYPFIGHTGHAAGSLEFVVPRTPYIVSYRIIDETIEILGVYHGRQSRRH